MKSKTEMNVVLWDCKEQIDLEQVNRAMADIEDPVLIEVETNSDQCAVVVATRGTSQRAAQAAYDIAVSTEED